MAAERGIPILSIRGRAKTLDSAVEKVRRKKYSDPANQLTDLCGIRLVTFLASDVTSIVDLLRELFDIDNDNSLDRAKLLGSDKIGYRSSHFVCTLGGSREKLPEYGAFKGLRFEVQVRTVLQHAWAELAHDRSYKFGPGLPAEIERKLNLYSGMLEIVDGAFDEISREIDAYSALIGEKKLGQIRGALSTPLQLIGLSKISSKLKMSRLMLMPLGTLTLRYQKLPLLA
jgi:ppGpp synthetase/RelA/SpoT-type nucleotidyltranferase